MTDYFRHRISEHELKRENLYLAPQPEVLVGHEVGPGVLGGALLGEEDGHEGRDVAQDDGGHGHHDGDLPPLLPALV